MGTAGKYGFIYPPSSQKHGAKGNFAMAFAFFHGWLGHPLLPVDERRQQAIHASFAPSGHDADAGQSRPLSPGIHAKSPSMITPDALSHAHFSNLPVRASTSKRNVILHTSESPPNSLPSNGRVAFLVRGESYRLGGRNLDTSQAGGCNTGGTDSQNQATHSLLNLLVQPLEARGNHVDMFVTETSGVKSPCPLVEPGLQAIYQGNRNRSVVFRTAVRMASQADSIRLALDFLKESADDRVESVYDLVLIVRHDMVWTEAIHKWPPPADFSRFSFMSACEKRSGDAEKCVSDTLLLMPGSLFPAFDSVAGAAGSRCFVADFRHGSGHECSGAITKATGLPPSLVTDYVPRGSVRRATPLGWLIGTPPEALDIRKMDKPREE